MYFLAFKSLMGNLQPSVNHMKSFVIAILTSFLLFPIAATADDQALLSAITAGDVAKTKALIGNRNPNDILLGSKQKSYPIIIASDKGHISIVKMLISMGADVNVHDKQGGYPLYYALAEDNLELAKLLLDKKALTEPPPKYNKERPALFWAVENDSPDMVSVLLNAKARVNASFQGMTLMEFAKEEAGEEVIALLKKAGG
jgi:ankyrin repeat protein